MGPNLGLVKLDRSHCTCLIFSTIKVKKLQLNDRCNKTTVFSKVYNI